MKKYVITLSLIFLFGSVAFLGLKNKRHCVAFAVEWESRYPKVTMFHGRDYASVWLSGAGRDQHFRNMVEEYRAEQGKNK